MGRPTTQGIRWKHPHTTGWGGVAQDMVWGADGALEPSLVGVDIGTAAGLFPSTNTH